jgi:hypothetical protein
MTRQSKYGLIVALLWPALPASAEPRVNTSPAAICRASGTGVARFAGDEVQNVDSTGHTLNLACPIPTSVRDNDSFNSVTSFLAAGGGVGCPSSGSSFNPMVTFFDHNKTQNAGCTLYVLGPGNVVQSVFTVTSSGATLEPQRKSWNVPRMDFTHLHLYADCVVPPPDPSNPQDLGGPTSSVEGFTIFTCDP